MSAPPSPDLVARRSVLRLGGAVGVLGVGLLSGCDLDPRSSPTPAPAVPDPDRHIVEAARAELRGLVARLSATAGAAPLVACHLTQLRALAGQPPPTTRRVRAFTPSQVVTREGRAAARFTRWALNCQDGDLARLLASVAAGIRMQHLPEAGS